MRAPDMPRGCPTAMAPPLTLTLAGSRPSSRVGGDPDGGERFVDFDEVEVGGVDAFLGAGLGDGAGGLGLEGGVGSGDDAVGADSAIQVRPSSSALVLLITITAAAPSEIGERSRR